MRTSTPVVTVVCLCFNTGRFVAEALACIRRQTYPAIEIIIVDDASTDGSVALIRRWLAQSATLATVIESPRNLGIPAALNRALAIAQGKYVTWLSDDLWEEDRVELVVAKFEALPGSVGVLFGDATIIDGAGTPTGELLSPYRTLHLLEHPQAHLLDVPEGESRTIDRRMIHDALFWRCFPPAPSVTVRRVIYDVIGPYDESLFVEDLDCWFRASEHFDFSYFRRSLVKYRVHSGNFSGGISDRFLSSLAETLRRRRVEPVPATTLAASRRHVREEAYRVINRLLTAGYSRKAIRVLVSYYLPNLQASSTATKETAKLIAAFLGIGSPANSRR